MPICNHRSIRNARELAWANTHRSRFHSTYHGVAQTQAWGRATGRVVPAAHGEVWTARIEQARLPREHLCQLLPQHQSERGYLSAPEGRLVRLSSASLWLVQAQLEAVWKTAGCEAVLPAEARLRARRWNEPCSNGKSNDERSRRSCCEMATAHAVQPADAASWRWVAAPAST